MNDINNRKIKDDKYNQLFYEKVKALKQRARQKEKECDSQYRAVKEWGSISDSKSWLAIREAADEDYKNGTFFIERLGRKEITDPYLLATLVNLRQQWIQEENISAIPEFMLMDIALISYGHFVNTNYTIGNIKAFIDRELFGLEKPNVVWSKYGLEITRLKAEDLLDRIIQKFLPTLDRYERMLLRAIKGIRDYRRTNLLLTIGQLNVGNKQINLHRK